MPLSRAGHISRSCWLLGWAGLGHVGNCRHPAWVWTLGSLHPPLHTPAPAVSGHPAAHTHCWWRGDVSSSHTSRWSHTACRAELPLVKRFQWRAVIGPGTIYTRIGKCLHYNYVSGMNRASRTGPRTTAVLQHCITTTQRQARQSAALVQDGEPAPGPRRGGH